MLLLVSKGADKRGANGGDEAATAQHSRCCWYGPLTEAAAPDMGSQASKNADKSGGAMKSSSSTTLAQSLSFAIKRRLKTHFIRSKEAKGLHRVVR